MSLEWAMRYLDDMEPLRAEEEMRLSRIVSIPHMSESHRTQAWSDMERRVDDGRNRSVVPQNTVSDLNAAGLEFEVV